MQGKNLSHVNVNRWVGGRPNVNQCKQRQVGGQKLAKFANVICEQPLTSFVQNKQALTWEIHCQKHIELWSIGDALPFGDKKMQKFLQKLKNKDTSPALAVQWAL